MADEGFVLGDDNILILRSKYSTMNIIYLTEDIHNYSAAYYQKDVLYYLNKLHDVYTYGPGFSNYRSGDTIQDIISKCEFDPDLISIGHKWLRDSSTAAVDPHPSLDLTETEIPCVIILNKEYTNFDKKIQFIEDNGIPLVFTHHHHAAQWTERYEPKFVFWPFAVNHREFQDFGEDKIYDLSFSGILRNPDPNVPQTDVRIRAQQEMFYSLGELKLALKPEYRDYNIFWRGKPTTKSYRILTKILHREGRLPDDDYKKLYNRSKLAFNSLSPMGLVGTRYYEAMASNSLVFCEESNIYTEYGLFEPGKHCVTYNSDLSEFKEKFEYYVNNKQERKQIAQQGHVHVMNNHTWEIRIKEFTRAIKKELL